MDKVEQVGLSKKLRGEDMDLLLLAGARTKSTAHLLSPLSTLPAIVAAAAAVVISPRPLCTRPVPA